MSVPLQHHPPLEDPRWGLVERILASPKFARSVRLTEFLRYICECSLSGRADEISEQQIGVHVFKRPANYNPNDDSIVRSHARLLRQSLDQYFDQQGHDEELRIVIPKGRYVPVFAHPKALQPSSSAPPAGPAPAVLIGRSGTHWRKWAAIASAAVAASLLALALFRWTGYEIPARPSAHAFWKDFFSGGRRVWIVPADSSLALLEDLTHQPVHLTDYLNRKYRFDLTGHAGWSETLLSSIAARQYTSMADLNLAVRLVRLREAANNQIQVRYARNVQLADLKEGSAILIGGPRANPWEELFESKMNFYIDFDPVTNANRVCNRSPRQGEQATYNEAQGESLIRAYGLIASLPGLTPASRTLIVEGTTSVGTECAAEFLLDESSLGAFLKQISAAGKTSPYFEVLLQTAPVAGNSQQSQVLAYRVLKN